MKTIALMFAFLFFACEQRQADPVDPGDCLAVDYYGFATWRLMPDSLLLDMNIDFTGKFTATIGAQTDSGRSVVALMSGKFVAPLGDEKFTRVGEMTLTGNFVEANGEYRILLNVINGKDGFKNVTGYLELIWQNWEEKIWYGGTFCF